MAKLVNAAGGGPVKQYRTIRFAVGIVTPGCYCRFESCSRKHWGELQFLFPFQNKNHCGMVSVEGDLEPRVVFSLFLPSRNISLAPIIKAACVQGRKAGKPLPAERHARFCPGSRCVHEVKLPRRKTGRNRDAIQPLLPIPPATASSYRKGGGTLTPGSTGGAYI